MYNYFGRTDLRFDAALKGLSREIMDYILGVNKIKSVFNLRPLMVLTFFYFMVPELFKHIFKTTSMKTLYNLCYFSKSYLGSHERVSEKTQVPTDTSGF